jgi:antitoxin component of RelBE/YafQ-DinJ toxin-antitoxin module
MDAIVTARIPVEVKEQGNAILKEIGSSPTKLINAAYSYLLATHQLPSAQVAVEYLGSPSSAGADGKRVRVITKEMRERLEQSLEACTLEMPQDFWDELGDRDYRDIIAEGRLADHEALG